MCVMPSAASWRAMATPPVTVEVSCALVGVGHDPTLHPTRSHVSRARLAPSLKGRRAALSRSRRRHGGRRRGSRGCRRRSSRAGSPRSRPTSRDRAPRSARSGSSSPEALITVTPATCWSAPPKTTRGPSGVSDVPISHIESPAPCRDALRTLIDVSVSRGERDRVREADDLGQDPLDALPRRCRGRSWSPMRRRWAPADRRSRGPRRAVGPGVETRRSTRRPGAPSSP